MKAQLKVSNTVLLKRPIQHSKLAAPFHEVPYKVIARKGLMITAIQFWRKRFMNRNSGQHKMTRNSSFFKPFNISTSEEDADLDLLPVSTGQEVHPRHPVVPSVPAVADSTTDSINIGVIRHSSRDRKTLEYVRGYVT